MKKLAIVSILLALVMAFAGCSLVTVNQERDLQRTVAKVEGEKITKNEYADALYYNLYIYVNYYGYDYDNLTTGETGEEFGLQILESLIQNKILVIQAQNYGCYDFTQEELDGFAAEYADVVEYYREDSQTSVEEDEANAGLSEEEIAVLVEEDLAATLEAIGYDEEAYIQGLKDQAAIDKLEEIITTTDDPTDEEIQAEYDTRVAEQLAEYTENSSAYESDLEGGSTTIYYNLPNTRLIKQILIAIPDETQDEIDALEEAGDQDAADALYAEEFAKLTDTANTVYELAISGEDFDELIAEYNSDPGMESYEFYAVAEGSVSYLLEFTEGAFALENIGDISEPIETDYGYHILLYYGESEEGAVDLAEVKDEISADLLADKQSQIYSDQLEAWREEMNIKIYEGRLSLDYDE